MSEEYPIEEELEEVMKENKQLKEKLEILKDGFDFNLGAIENIRKENHKLEDKIDKAIEYIKKNSYGWETKYYDDDFNANELLEILGDKENE